MAEESSTASTETPVARSVLLWRPDSDETNVWPSVEKAAEFLKVDPEAIVAAISSGDLLAGWFVDWQVIN